MQDKLNTQSLPHIVKQLKEACATGDTYKIELKKFNGNRTISQNSTMWIWLSEIARQACVDGEYFDNETWHEYFKKYWCPVKVKKIPKGELKVKSTKLLDTGEMHHYMQKIEEWCQGHMIIITIPIKSEYREIAERMNQ